MIPGNRYAQWRLRSGLDPGLRDAPAAPPPERLLQSVWLHQRLRRDDLRTLDGMRLRVLHPGFLSREGGPDFRGAVLQFGEGAPLSGDVEVDIRPGGWRAHGHDRNPAFENVILHVVWEGDRPPGRLARTPARLELRRVLDAPLHELSLWLGGEPAQTMPESSRGQCAAPLRELPAAPLQSLLRGAAQVRLRGKAAQFQARARQAGWEQSLWEGLFRALGYKRNVWPMQRLAELRAHWRPENQRLSPTEVQARLFGLSGLLPAELSRSQAADDAYLRGVWDYWWRERDAYGECVLPRSLWRFHGLRPANQPQRRLALAAHWAAEARLPAKLTQWCAARLTERALPASLFEILSVGRDDFWSWHWTLRSPRLPKPQPMLGAMRTTDLAVNVILPWLLARAMEGRSTEVMAEVERRYFAWPAAEDNATLKLARQRLLGANSTRALRSAAAQQGLIQIVRDYCDHSNAVCANCSFPELVRSWDRSVRQGESTL